MKKIFVVYSSLFMVQFGFSQNEQQIKKISSDICPCIEKTIKSNPASLLPEVMQTCMTASLKKFASEIASITDNGKNKEKIKSLTENAAKHLAVTCPAFTQLFLSQGAKVLKDNNKIPFSEDKYSKSDCKEFNDGKFVQIFNYVNGHEMPIEDKTAYSIVKNGIWTDFMSSSKYKTVSAVTVKSSCNLSLTIKSNNNPLFATMLKPGSVSELEILGVDKKDKTKFYVLVKFNGINIYQILQKK